MAKHRDTSGSHNHSSTARGHQAKHAADKGSTHIGQHRERTDVHDDPQGFSVGRGVPETHER